MRESSPRVLNFRKPSVSLQGPTASEQANRKIGREVRVDTGSHKGRPFRSHAFFGFFPRVRINHVGSFFQLIVFSLSSKIPLQSSWDLMGFAQTYEDMFNARIADPIRNRASQEEHSNKTHRRKQEEKNEKKKTTLMHLHGLNKKPKMQTCTKEDPYLGSDREISLPPFSI